MTRENELARVEAILAGEPTYHGTTCRHGHASPRSTADGRCIECRRETWRRWRDRNPEKALDHLERMLTEKGVMGGNDLRPCPNATSAT